MRWEAETRPTNFERNSNKAEGFGVRRLDAALSRSKAVPRHRTPKRFARHGA